MLDLVFETWQKTTVGICMECEPRERILQFHLTPLLANEVEGQ